MVESPTKFSKKKGGGGFTALQFLDGGCWGRWRCDFPGGLVVHFLHENNLNSEIFNENKSLLTKMFSSVSLNSEFSYFLKMRWCDSNVLQCIKRSKFFSKPFEPFGGDINVTVDLSNYATKTKKSDTC